jgi:hypothetical protein
VNGPMPAMNELIDAKSRMGKNGKKRFNLYNALKKEWHATILASAERCALQQCGPSYFTFFVVERDQRRDPDGFSFGANKLIFDALVEGGFIRNDGWKDNLGFVNYWTIGALDPGVYVFIRPDRVLTREECVERTDDSVNQ